MKFRITVTQELAALWLKIMKPAKVKKSQDFLAQVNRWEGWVNTLKRQEVAGTAWVGLLTLVAPDKLRWTVLERADRLREYRQVKEKMVMLLDARGQLKDPNAMDIGYAGEEDWTWETEPCDFEVGVIGRSDHSYRTSQPSARRRKAREDRTFFAKVMKGQEKGKCKAAGGKGHDKGKGKGSMFCHHGGKRGHDASRCWALHPEQLVRECCRRELQPSVRSRREQRNECVQR